MGGGTAPRPRPWTEGRAPAFNMCAKNWSLRWRYVGSNDHASARARARPPRPAQFDGKPFNKGSMAASVIATVAGGAGVICFAAFFQNKKHGFIK